MKILFVCTGNTCRSPIAETVARNKISNATFESAGVFAIEGEDFSKYAEKVLQENFYELNDFKSRRLNMEMLRRADLVLVMTSEQKEIIKTFFEEERAKIYTLKEYNDKERENKDIQDPFGGNLLRYRKILQEIENEISMLEEKIKKNN